MIVQVCSASASFYYDSAKATAIPAKYPPTSVSLSLRRLMVVWHLGQAVGAGVVEYDYKARLPFWVTERIDIINYPR